MKVTQMSTYRSLSYQLEKTAVQRNRLFEQSSTGKRVSRSSDEPAAIAPILRSKEEIEKADSYLKTIGSSQNDLNIADGHLSKVSALMIRAKEIAVAGSNSTKSAADMQTLAKEVSQLKTQLLDIANAQVGGKYIFSGYADTTKPFSGTPVSYNGTNDHKMLEVSSGQTVQTNLTGSELFTSPRNVFSTLDNLESALNSGNHSRVKNQLGDIELSTEQIRLKRSELGNVNSRLGDVKNLTEGVKLQITKRLSSYEDADLVGVMTELTKTEQSLQASLSIAARVSKISLLDYL